LNPAMDNGMEPVRLILFNPLRKKKKINTTNKRKVKEKNRLLTEPAKMRASQSQWEWFHSGCSGTVTYIKKAHKVNCRRKR